MILSQWDGRAWLLAWQAGAARSQSRVAMELTFLLQLLINGLVVGMVYALIATGLSLIFGVLEIVNFAHGEFYMLGAMLAYFLSTQLHLPYWWIIASVVLVSFALGYLLYVTLLSAMRGANFERSMLLTLGLSMVLQNGAIYLFSTTPRMMRTEYSFQIAMVCGRWRRTATPR
jgi:branched-chain amino acid transport system permease protein